jgi:transposase InsO family protein
MAWKEVSVMNQRLELCQLMAAGSVDVSELCKRFGVSRQTAYKWAARFKAGGAAGLVDLSRRPLTSPARTDSAIEAAAVLIRQKHPTWGGRKIRARLAHQAGEKSTVSTIVPGLPAISTFTGILRRHGMIDPVLSAQQKPFVRFEREHPNELWQMDFKGWFDTNTARCHPLTVLDDHSRFNLVLAACADEKTATVREKLTSAFALYGLPASILCDNGPPFGGVSDHGLTPLAVWLMRLGITVTHGRPRHPQTQGKEERFHRTLKADLLRGRTFNDLKHAQRHFDPFRREYNYQRPHEALGMATPSQRYKPSHRSFPTNLPAVEYTPGDEVRKVQDKGVIFFKGKPWPVAVCLRGQPVALRATEIDGCFDIRFCAQTVGHLDLRNVRGKE